MKNENQIPPFPGPSCDLYRDARNHRPDLTWNYAAKGFFRRGETSILFGPSNCGKSALICHLGNCVVTGREFFGARVTKGVVVHVGAEAPVSVLDRIHAHDLQTAPDAAPYVVRMAPVDLSSEAETEAFTGDLAQIHHRTGEKIVLIVFDTLARSIGTSEENCATAMTGIANAAERIARRQKAHVMLVHHTGKDTDRGGRGSSALRGAVDTEVSLAPLKCGAVIARQEKQRTMPKSGPVWFRTECHVLGQDEDGEDRTTVKGVELAEPPKSEEAKGGSETASDFAVHTALNVWRLTGMHSAKAFRPRDVLDVVPPELFGSIAETSRLRNVSRSLGKLAARADPIVAKAGDAWRLVDCAGSES